MTEIQHKTKQALYDQKVPNLVELQIKSYEWFLKEGLKELMQSFSPIHNYDGTSSIEFIGDPYFEEPKNTEDDCRNEMSTYEGRIKVRVRLVHTEDGIQNVTEEDIYLAELPKMTDNGTFYINGAERVVVSQLSRSPGAYFEDNFDNSGNQLYVGKILPTTGAWIEMFTENNELKAHIAQGSKFPITVLLRALNNLPEACPVLIDKLLGEKLTFDIVSPKGEIIYTPKTGKSKKTSKKEVSIINEEHIKNLKSIFGDYIYTDKIFQISTTEDILNTFGKKEFVKISQLFQISNFKKDSKGEFIEIENEIVSIPALDSNPKLNNLFRILDRDIYRNKNEEPIFCKGQNIDDKSLIVNLPTKEITIGEFKFNRDKCIEYLIDNNKVETKEYKKAIKNVECEEANLLIEYLTFLHKKNQGENSKPYYNITDLRPVNDIVDSEGEIKVKAFEPIPKDVAEYLYNQGNNVYLECYNVSELISNTIKIEDPDDGKKLEHVVDARTGLLALQKYMRPKEPSSEQAALTLVKNYLFDNRRYDVGKVGRYKLNRKLGLNLPDFAELQTGNTRSITRDDIVKLIKYTIYLSKEGKIVTYYNDQFKDKILEKINEYISKVKKGKIEGIKSINIEEKTDPQKGTTINVDTVCAKYEKIEDSILDGRNALYSYLINIINNAEKGYLISRDDYLKLEKFLSVISNALDEDVPYIKYALSDSPQNLNKEYVMMRVTPCITDEIDHLENKRVRSVGELLQEALRNGFVRMERVAKDKMNQNDKDKMSINTLITNKPVTSVIRSFFQTSQLSQFMDQTNPLAELTHKRRLSALGPGGLSRQSAKIEVRDVHHSHYGRICPIETPEGPNIGLIGSMAIHARINEYGFLETPYRIVSGGKITDEIRFLSAEEESHEYIATARTAYDSETKQITEKTSVVRHNGKYPNVECDRITLMEISPNQIMSVAANLIPFIENDDANRALMGSNMQRQAVPLLKPTAPIVRTGIEERAAHDSGVEKFALRDGKVVWVSCESIIVLPENPDYIDRYEVSYSAKKKYTRGDNLFTCIKKRYSIDDKERTNLIDEISSVPLNSIITRDGKPTNIKIDDVNYLMIEPVKEDSAVKSEIVIDANDDIVKGNLIFDGKIYEGKSKTYISTGKTCNCINGIIESIEKLPIEDEDEPEEKIKVTISELDIYCLEPKVVRNTFPADYAIVKFGNINIKAVEAGVGASENNKVVIDDSESNKYIFETIVCDQKRLSNMIRSNQGTCINSRAMVEMGRRVHAGELLADGPCTDHGELALGQNVTVAFLPWNGYNYEDAILLNEKLVKDDKFSSIHIEKYEIEARDTKLGPEEITRDIPNVGDEKLKDLDDNGIIKIGAHVKAENILVGKIAPKGEKEPDPEEKLIRSIFGNKAKETRDVSLKVPHGESGTIVDVKILSKFKYKCSSSDCGKTYEPCKKMEKDEMFCKRCGSKLEELPGDQMSAGVNQLVRVYIAQKRKIMKGDKMAGRHGNKGVISNILQEADMPFKPDGMPVDIVLNPLGVPSRMNIGQILETHQGYAGTHLGLKFKNPIFQSATEREIIADLEIMTTRKLIDALLKYLKELEINVKVSDRQLLKATNNSIDRVKKATGSDLDTVAQPLYDIKQEIYDKVLDIVKSYDAYDLEILSRNLCCDSVISESSEDFENTLEEIKDLNHSKFRVENSEDSMFEENALVDDLDEIEAKIKELKSADYNVPNDYNFNKLLESIEKIIIKRVGFVSKLAKTDLYDGKTGDKLKQKVCVGTIYMLKLHHLVEDKIHARATGPYSLVTQQPLGGKAQFGGQRFGEMEVWALEAYGAANTLQEILTIKSDDVIGRVDTYEAIVKGKAIPNAGIPESFKILVNELQSLCLKINVQDEEENSLDIRTYDDTPLKA